MQHNTKPLENKKSKAKSISCNCLLTRANTGDVYAFESLYLAYYPDILEYIRCRVGNGPSDDLAQEVFLRVWDGRARNKKPSDGKAFLLRIARNVVYEHWRRLTRRTDKDQRTSSTPGTTSPCPTEQLEQQECLELVRRIKEQLSTKQREALELALSSSLSSLQAAERLGCSEHVYRQRLADARKRCRELMTGLAGLGGIEE